MHTEKRAQGRLPGAANPGTPPPCLTVWCMAQWCSQYMPLGTPNSGHSSSGTTLFSAPQPAAARNGGHWWAGWGGVGPGGGNGGGSAVGWAAGDQGPAEGAGQGGRSVGVITLSRAGAAALAQRSGAGRLAVPGACAASERSVQPAHAHVQQRTPFLNSRRCSEKCCVGVGVGMMQLVRCCHAVRLGCQGSVLAREGPSRQRPCSRATSSPASTC